LLGELGETIVAQEHTVGVSKKCFINYYRVHTGADTLAACLDLLILIAVPVDR